MKVSTLFHFLLMIKMGGQAFTKECIELYLTVALEKEGKAYIDDLKSELPNLDEDQYSDEFAFDRETALIIVESIKTFTF